MGRPTAAFREHLAIMREICDRAEVEHHTRQELLDVRRERDCWRSVAESLGAGVAIERRGDDLRLHVTVSAFLLSQAHDHERIVDHLCARVHRELTAATANQPQPTIQRTDTAIGE